MKTHEEQIEELEKGCGKIVNYFAELICEGKNIQYCHTCTRKAKELKEEIENNLKFHRGLVCCPETCFCWDLEEQIEKLNKIIGSLELE